MTTSLYIPPEIWDKILSFLPPLSKKCEGCYMEYCVTCSKKTMMFENPKHVICVDCNELCCGKGKFGKIQHCLFCTRCIHKNCMTQVTVTLDNATTLKEGCKACINNLIEELYKTHNVEVKNLNLTN